MVSQSPSWKVRKNVPAEIVQPWLPSRFYSNNPLLRWMNATNATSKKQLRNKEVKDLHVLNGILVIVYSFTQCTHFLPSDNDGYLDKLSSKGAASAITTLRLINSIAHMRFILKLLVSSSCFGMFQQPDSDWNMLRLYRVLFDDLNCCLSAEQGDRMIFTATSPIGSSNGEWCFS